jgi:ribosome biogenesis GTPase / thiamine phosphate phosphatase
MDDKNKQITKYRQSMKKHVAKQKLRKARKKAGTRENPKKPRQKDWIPDAWDEWEDLEYPVLEKVMPRGSADRRREVARLADVTAPDVNSEGQPVSEDADASLGSDDTQRGLVVEASSGMCRVSLNEKTILCHLRGNLKSAQSDYTNAIAVGDQVIISTDGDNPGVVERVLPRRNILARPSMTDKGQQRDLQQIIVANIDRLLIVASWREPNFWPELIDRYLITAQRNQLEVVLCINKVDLVTDQTEFDALQDVYHQLGQEIIVTSTITGQGIPELETLFRDSTTVLAGLSGVGKSSLLVAVQPDLNLRTAHVSQRGLFTGQGRHTTTQSSLWQLENGGVVIDTPGIRDFGLAGVPADQLALWYPEMVPLLDGCRFADCTHSSEPGCAVLDAVETGIISALRYKNYSQILASLQA